MNTTNESISADAKIINTTIEKNVKIFERATVKNSELQKRFEDQGQCQIGHDVWIATNVVILRNIKIGNGAVIGAGAIVTKDVEPYSIVVGVPGKVVKKRFDNKTIEALEEIQWWNWPRKVINQNIDLIYSTKVDEACLEKLRQISRSL